MMHQSGGTDDEIWLKNMIKVFCMAASVSTSINASVALSPDMRTFGQPVNSTVLHRCTGPMALPAHEEAIGCITECVRM